MAPSSTAAASKRYPRHSPVAPFRALSPRMKFSPNETLFRILCPTDWTCGVISKGGSIVRQSTRRLALRSEPRTSSRDPRTASSSSLRCHRRTAEGTTARQLRTIPPQPSGPLVRIFERVHRVESERVGEGNGGGEGGEKKEIEGAGGLQASGTQQPSGVYFFGKGGKIVEKIRQESRA